MCFAPDAVNRRGPIAAFLKGIHILIDDAVRSMRRQVNLVMVVVLMRCQNEICRDIIAFSGEGIDIHADAG